MGEVNRTKSLNSSGGSYTEFFYKAFRNILLVSVPLLVLSALILGFSISHSSATTSGSDSLSISILSACTIDSIIESNHTATVNAGTHTSDIGSTRINAYCNDNNGYSIYAIGSSNNVDGNTDLVNASISSNYNIHTGIYDENSSNSLAASSWAMKLTAGSGSGIDTNTGSSIPLTPPTIMNGYNNYNVIPSSYTLVASRTSGTNMTIDTDVTGSYFTTTYDVYASSAQPAGSYEGKVKYVMVHPNSNSSNTIPDINAAFATAGKQKVYQDQNGSYYAMQDMTSEICDSVTRTGEITATQLVDTRDNKLYWVAKLDDDKCWMTSNLDLEIGNTNMPLNSNTTDISTNPEVYASTGIYSGYTVSGGVYTWDPVSTAVTSGRTISGTGVTGWSNSATVPYSAEGGDTYYYTSNTTSADTRYNSLKTCKDAGHTEAECKRYFAGNYYNWTAAIASNNSTNISTNDSRVPNSICPKGWRLPNASQTDNEYNEFGRMFFNASITAKVSNGNDSVSYKDGGFNKIRSSPYYFVRSGVISASSLVNPGILGYYWSSTANSSSSNYGLRFDSGSLRPAYGVIGQDGWSVRCVARQP